MDVSVLVKPCDDFLIRCASGKAVVLAVKGESEFDGVIAQLGDRIASDVGVPAEGKIDDQKHRGFPDRTGFSRNATQDDIKAVVEANGRTKLAAFLEEAAAYFFQHETIFPSSMRRILCMAYRQSSASMKRKVSVLELQTSSKSSFGDFGSSKARMIFGSNGSTLSSYENSLLGSNIEHLAGLRKIRNDNVAVANILFGDLLKPFRQGLIDQFLRHLLVGKLPIGCFNLGSEQIIIEGLDFAHFLHVIFNEAVVKGDIENHGVKEKGV